MGFFINKIVSKYLLVIATLALLVTTYTVNSTCLFAIHQEELPEEAFKLRKFWYLIFLDTEFRFFRYTSTI